MPDEGARMKLQRDATYNSLTDKLEKLEDYVSGTVHSVSDSVQSAQDSVNIKHHVRRRPWTLVAGAVALGFLGGYRSRRGENGDTARNGEANAVPQNPAPAPEERRPRPVHDGNGAAAEQPPTDNSATQWAKSIGNSLDPDFTRLKTLATGMLTGLARDALHKQASRPEKSPAGSRGDNGR